MPLFLYEKQLISHPSFYISSFFESERNIYYDKLENISKMNAWDDWIEFFLEATIFQANSQMSLAKNILGLYEEMKITIAELTRSHFVIKVIDFIFSHPIFKGANFVRDTEIPKATTSRLLNILVEGNILLPVREKTGRAGQIYRFNKLLNLLMFSAG